MNDNSSCPIQSIEEVQNDLMDNMYIANVLNRIRELQSPSPVDRTRWLWELLQNAQDSIKPDQQVKAKVKIYDDRSVTFEHTGGIFTGKAMCGLLYKYSEGKGNEESTGRFGTGFMTTLTLSEIIEVETNIYEDTANTKVSGFCVTLYRNGTEKDELKKGLRDMRNSFKKVKQFKDFTTKFKYRNSNEIAIELGYKSFINCGAQTMLFATKVQNFTFDYKNKTSSIERGKHDQIDDNLSIHSFTVNDETNYERKFILISIRELNEILSKKFKKDRQLRLQIAIEFTGENKLVSHEDKTCLYCTFPFIGSESHQLPFLMNCPDFEPDTERQSLLLEGDDYIYKNDVTIINSPLINKLILNRSLDLFKKLLEHLIKNQFQNCHLLTNGLIHFDNIKHMNKEWYFNEVVVKMRKLLEESPIVKTIDNEMTLLKDAYFPIYKEKSDEKQRKMYHNLVSHRYPNKTVTFEESEHWEYRTWNELHLIKIEDLISNEETLSQEKTKQKEKINEEEWEYLNLLLEYSKLYELNLLNDHSIIPDMNEDRHPYSENFYESKEIHEDMLNILDSIKHPWKSQHMHNNINKIEIHKHSMNDAIEACIDMIKNNSELSYIVSRYLPKDNSRRQTIFKFINEILQHPIEEYHLQYEIDPKLWIISDCYLINQFLDTIEQYNTDEVSSRFELCHEFVSFLNEQEVEKKYLNERAIVPNQNNVLCKLSALRDNSNIPEKFKSGVLFYFQIDIDDDELNHKITDIQCPRHSEISIYQDIINERIQEVDKKVEASSFLLHFRPKKEENIYEKIDQLQKLYQIFFVEEESKYIIDNKLTISIDDIIPTNLSSFALWNNASKYIIEKLLRSINQCSQFQEFQDSFNFDEEKAISILNQCYLFEPNIKIPLLNGSMVEYKSCYKSDGIDKKIIEFITAVDNNDSILSELAWSGINHPDLKQFESYHIILKIQRATGKMCQDEKLRDDPRIRKLINEINLNVMDNILNYNSLSDVDKEKLSIFSKLFVSNLGPRLRELENPSDNIKKRWAWELIQNAKDTIASQPNRKVNIKFTYDLNHLIFQHDGNDFTLKQYLAMVYKFSEDKHEQKGSTGRFGTGFLTTHIISNKVILRGNLLKDNELKGFEVTLDRSGHKDIELEESMKRTEESKKMFNNKFDYTSFEYKYNDKEHVKRVEMGIENLMKNLPFVLLFCRNINSVTIENLDKNEKVEFSLEPETKQGINEVKIKKNDDDISTRRFIYFHTEKESNFVSNWYNQPNRKIEVNAVLEIDSNNKIVSHRGTESLYCVFPLIGSKFLLPFIIDSPDFETTTERDSIFLKESSNNQSTVDNINYEILGIGLELYQTMIEFCIRNNISCLYYLAKGLNNCIPQQEHFNRETFSKLFLTKAKEILSSRPVFLTTNGYKCINEASLIDYAFPTKGKIDKEKVEKFKKDFYSIFSRIYMNPIEFEESKHWSSLLWTELSAKKHLNLLNKISQFELITKIQLVENNKITRDESLQIQLINDTIDFVLEFDKVQLTEIKLIPNQNKEFCIDNSEFYFANEVIEEAVTLIHRLGGEWRENHVFRGIIEKDFLPRHKIQDSETEIINRINTRENAMILMEYIIPGNQERIKMHDYSHSILGTPAKSIELPGYSNAIWSSCDKVIIKCFIQKIQDLQSIRHPIESVAWLNDLISFCLQKGLLETELKKYSVFPNQNNCFKSFNSVYIDEIQFDEIKDALFENCQIDARSELLHKDFTIDLGFRTKLLDDFSQQIDQFYFESPLQYYCYGHSYSYNKNKVNFSMILLKYISNKTNIQQDQKDLIKVTNFLLNKNITGIELKSSMSESNFQYVSRTVAVYINHQLMDKTLDNLVSTTGKELNEIIKCLNILYKFSKDDTYVPNQQKKFCKYRDLKVISETDNISDIINFQVLLSKIIKPEESLTNIIVHDGIICTRIINTLDLQRACSIIDSLIIENYVNITNSNNNYIKVILNDLITYIDSNNYWQYFPNLRIKHDSLISNFIVSNKDRKVILEINKLPQELQRKVFNLVKDLSNDEDLIDILNSLDLIKNDNTSLLSRKEQLISIIHNHYYDNRSFHYYDYRSYHYHESRSYHYHDNRSCRSFNRNRSYFNYDDRSYYQAAYRESYFFNEYDGQFSSRFITSISGNWIQMSNNGNSLDNNRIIGYKGEAYAYEKLKRAGFEVEWPNLSNKVENSKVVFNGTIYYIKESYKHYDLKATKDGHEFYYEVKTTVFSDGGNGFTISPSQVNFLSHYTPNATKRIMLVFNIRSSNPRDIQLELLPDKLMLKYIG